MDFRKTTLKELELFMEIARLGSIHEVARSQGMAVAQLSRTLRRFEGRVRKRLFERSPRGVVLTTEGLAMRLAVEKGLAELGLIAKTEIQPQSQKTKIDGLAAPSYLLHSHVIPLVSQLKEKELISSAKIVELPPDRLVLAGLRGIIMSALHAGKLDWPSTWSSTQVASLEWGLLGSKRYFNKTQMTESEVLKFDFVYPVYWSPEGLRESDDGCPIPIQRRSTSIGVSTAQMGLEVIHQNKALIFAPLCLLNEKKHSELIRISVASWPKVKRPIYFSVQKERMTQRLLKNIISLIKKLKTKNQAL